MKQFTSQVCTDRHQRQRLLEMGLKKETADMYIFDDEVYIGKPNIDDIPAWSLHRLIEILPSEIKPRNDYYSLTFDKVIIQYECYDYGVEVLKSFGDSPYIYDNIVDCIEWLISEGYFNKEYLKQ